ncbi:Molybdopterin-synthase adenylyltransferase [hydrothermal vent metagenome]|uniref:Molybdopterin-synthase adenylyltransferase n=1 Tax=hydrothermal vent metagenome TaxID=652676 RepID=A0A3B0TDI9_9ZZZZ
MALSDTELERYARHIILREVGGGGQQTLKSARVLVVGAGGLGAPVLQYLAAAGIGTLGVIDDDTVALSNLQRQVIHDTASVGAPKTASAEAAIRRLNPGVTVEPHQMRLAYDNAADLISSYDVIVDGSDNFATRYLVSDAAFFAARPVVSAAVGRFDGQITTLAPHLAAPDSSPRPTYRCLYPAPPPDGTVPACEEAGILGVVTGILGTLQANEVLKLVLGIGTPLFGRLLMVDTLTPAFDIISYGWNAANPLNGEAPTLGPADIGQNI